MIKDFLQKQIIDVILLRLKADITLHDSAFCH